MQKAKLKNGEKVVRDRWIPSVCSICYSQCSILGHVVDGRLVKIEGNPNSPCGSGRLCAKGASGIMILYDPNRVKVPLMRTNPEKGIGVDPKWKEITWDEAIDIVVEKLKKIMEDDPRKLFSQGTTTMSASLRKTRMAFQTAFGSSNTWAAGGGLHCGNGAHVFGGLNHASWSIVPDFQLCNYALYFGASKGHSAGHVANQNAQLAADARARGMKMVVVDPMCNFAAAKATEWVPIRVGTDAALALAMVNLLLNEYKIYDQEYLKFKTNASYLIGPDGRNVRDKSSDKPLVWDGVNSRAAAWDDPEVTDLALEGEYDVDGVKCRPAFVLLKEHVQKYTPEYASKITTVPAENIRRLAREFGEEARIGSTISIDGKTLPFRPAAAIFFRGAQGHKNSMYNCASIDLLNQVVGSADVPGGCLGFNPAGLRSEEIGGRSFVGNQDFMPHPDKDGLMIVGTWMGAHRGPYPMHGVGEPSTMSLIDAFPLAMITPFLVSSDQEEWWQKFKLPYRPEMMLNVGANSVLSVGNSEVVTESFKKIPFIVSIDLFLTEYSDLADIVLPDTSYMERFDPEPQTAIFNHPAGMGEWGYPIGQPLVEPEYERRGCMDFYFELANRLGLAEEFNAALNLSFSLKGPYRLEDDRKFTYDDLCDRVLKNKFGEEHGLEWFSENGVLKWRKSPEEAYWRAFVKVRIPVYLEFLIKLGEQTKELWKSYGLTPDLTRFSPLPDWYPCLSHEEKDPKFDLIGFYYRDTLHANSFTMENPWLDEAAQMNPYSYHVVINAAVGKAKGLKDGDQIIVESVKGRKVQGRVKLAEGIHPEALGVASCAGHWTKGQPVAKGKGVRFNDLLEIDYEHADPGNLNMDLCVKVRIYKA